MKARLEALDMHVDVRVQREQRPGHRIHALRRGHMARLDHERQAAAAAVAGLRGGALQRKGRRVLCRFRFQSCCAPSACD